MAFVKAASLDELWNGEMKGVLVDHKNVLLIRVDDKVYAYEDRCAHKGVPLSSGKLDHGTLTCSAHDWQYDSCTGKSINPQGEALRAYAVEIKDGNILIDLEDDFDSVGPVLHAGAISQAIIAAIREENPSVRLIDRGSYLRVLVPNRCVVSSATIEKNLGQPFHLPGDLELLMPSFKGFFKIINDQAIWEFTSEGAEEKP